MKKLLLLIVVLAAITFGLPYTSGFGLWIRYAAGFLLFCNLLGGPVIAIIFENEKFNKRAIKCPHCGKGPRWETSAFYPDVACEYCYHMMSWHRVLRPEFREIKS